MNDFDSMKKKRGGFWVYLMVIAILSVFVIALWLGLSSNEDNDQKTGQSSENKSNVPVQKTANSLISYSLPPDWSSVSCEGSSEIILIVPSGKVSPRCDTVAENWPIRIFIDQKNTKDCNQIEVDNQQVTKHTCSSKFTDGHKTLVVSTTYNEKSQYARATTVSEYYIDTSNGVVKLEAKDDLASADDDHQAEFDQIANSVKVK